METVAFFESVLAVINDARVALGLTDLLDINAIESSTVNTVYRQNIVLNDTSDTESTEDESKTRLLQKLKDLLSSDAEDADISSQHNMLTSSKITHIDAHFDISDGSTFMRIILFSMFLELSQISPVIDGDLVVEGITLTSTCGPSACRIEYAADHDESFLEIVRIGPWQMMFTPAVDGEGANNFAIPVSIAPEYREGSIKVFIYVADVSTVPYMDEPESYDYDGAMSVCAIEYTVRSAGASGVPPLEDPLDAVRSAASFPSAEGDSEGGLKSIRDLKTPPTLIVRSVRAAIDYDEVQQLRSEGYELSCVHLTPDGSHDDQEHLWKFHIMAQYGPPSEGGVEDVAFLAVRKGLGTLPVLKHFEILHDTDLTDPEEEMSVFLAVRTGERPQFTKLRMVTCVPEEYLISGYVKERGAVLRESPEIISKIMGLPSGIMMESPFLKEGLGDEKQSQSSDRSKSRFIETGGDDDDDARSEGELSRVTNDSDFEGDDKLLDEEEVISTLEQRLAALEAEKEELSGVNAELQKKCSALIINEKRMQIQNSATKSAVAETIPLDAEQLQEKEKLFKDTIELITEARTKFSKQQTEFDQLALDLQTRLDDKEFKAGEISTSFKAFKREILSKSVNSRTGKSLSKRMIQQFEAIELKREEDLEKVRLKNISLRSNLRKLERALRAKEQLAEGLHMIDFEQLKIENQTLNEKIEERNEELAKLKRKKTVTVQVLTHVREKLRFIEKNNKVVHAELDGIEAEALELRAQLAAMKKERDGVKEDNKELKRQQGFATSDLLLVDFEVRKTSLESMRAEIRELQDRYRILARQAGVVTTAGGSSKLGSSKEVGGVTKFPSLTVGKK